MNTSVDPTFTATASHGNLYISAFPTPSATETQAATATTGEAPTNSATDTATNTPTNTATFTPTMGMGWTPPPTSPPGPTATDTPPPSSTHTPTWTPRYCVCTETDTPTSTPTPTCGCVNDCSLPPVSVSELCPYYDWVVPSWIPKGDDWSLVVKNCGGVAVAYNFDGSGCYAFEIVWDMFIKRLYAAGMHIRGTECTNPWTGQTKPGGEILCADACTQSYDFCGKTPPPAGETRALIRDERVAAIHISKKELDRTDQSDFPLTFHVELRAKQELRWKESADTPGDGGLAGTWYWTLHWWVRIDRDPEATEPYERGDYSGKPFVDPYVVRKSANHVEPCP